MYIDSAYDIDYKGLYDKGYRGIIFDVDNTLVEHGAPVTERAKKLFGDLKAMGYNTCIISNNKEYRVKPLADEVGSLYVSKAGKPSPKNYVKAMEYMNTDKSDTYFVGDQLFTDVWGANRAGIKSVLVKPIDKHLLLLSIYYFLSIFLISSINVLTSLNSLYTEANLTYATSSKSFNLSITIEPIVVVGISFSSILNICPSMSSTISLICFIDIGRLWHDLTIPATIFSLS
jgi:uncharacterized protein